MPIDYATYPDTWLYEIRPRIMERANNTCEFDGCSFRHGQTAYSVKVHGKSEWFHTYRDAVKAVEDTGWNVHLSPPNVKQVKVVLTIAHLDHDEENHDVKDERLAAACQLCHLRYDAEEKAWRQRLKDLPILLSNWRP